MIQESSSLKNQELTLKNWTIELQDDPETGDLILPFPEDMLQEAGWKEGDVLDWKDNQNGSWSLTKRVYTSSMNNKEKEILDITQEEYQDAIQPYCNRILYIQALELGQVLLPTTEILWQIPLDILS